jgi:membrane protease YdiL (CAAX protease family)
MSMLKQSVYSSLLGFGCLVGVYVPTFVLVSVLIKLGDVSKADAQIAAIPLIILISAGLALAVMAFLARKRRSSLAAYGFKSATLRQLALALILGLVFALGLKALSRILPLGASADLGALKQWQVILFFWIAAPVQEETIFRGLIQSVVQTRNPLEFSVGVGDFKLPFAVLVSALLFAAVHIATVRLGASLSEALFVVCGAFVLGIVAGWLRWKSGSLLPAILLHAIFNILAG